MPATRRGGGRRDDHRATLGGISRILRAGARRRDPPERHGRCKSAHGRFGRRGRGGTIGRILGRLRPRSDGDGDG